MRYGGSRAGRGKGYSRSRAFEKSRAYYSSVLSHANVDNDRLARNPLTRPAPAEESAGCGPPSPPRGRGTAQRRVLLKIMWDRAPVTHAKFKKDVNLEGTNSTSPLESTKHSKNELKTNSKRTPNELEKPAYDARNRPNNANAMQGEAQGRICFWLGGWGAMWGEERGAGRTKCRYVLSFQFLSLPHSTFHLCHSLPVSRHPAYMNCSRQDWNGLIQHR